MPGTRRQDFNAKFRKHKPSEADVARSVADAAASAAELLIFGGAFAAAAADYRQHTLEVVLQSYVHQHIYEPVG